MKKITTLLLMALSFGAFAQDEIVNIPDANFKAYLVGNTAINTNNDTEISVAEAEAFTGEINCFNKNISDLTGIKSFVNLTDLYCLYNSLTSLDVTGLTSLTELDCSNNSLTSLDIIGLTNLTELICHNNSLTSLDVTDLTSLRWLDCSYNSLTSLNVTGLISLKYLECFHNSTLKEICIATTHNASIWSKDDSAEWSTTCKPLAFLETESTKNAKILKAYNPQGQEVPVNTKGEVIILLYDNGVREKTYVAE